MKITYDWALWVLISIRSKRIEFNRNLPTDPNIVEHGIPHIIHYGDFGQYKVLVMTKTGPDLDDLKYDSPDEKFTFSTICKIAIQGVCKNDY